MISGAARWMGRAGRARMEAAFLVVVLLLALGVLGGYIWQTSQVTDRPVSVRPSRALARAINEPIEPIPLSINLDARKVELGRALFHDPQLSHNNTISCATCHNLELGGTDRLARSVGMNGAVVPRNAPTVFNSGFNFRQFWDGRRANLEEQITGPLVDPSEMASSWPEVIGKLSQSPSYTEAFAEIYPDRITSANVADAIATFERSLYTPNARFDRFLRGDIGAISADQKEGYRLFKAYGCISCHQGVNVGGNMFQRMGVAVDYFGARGEVTDSDLGRLKITGDERDRHVFKVPSLRNIVQTPPYFHDGSAPTLEDAVSLMGIHQLGRELPKSDIGLIVQFLGTLTGEVGGVPLR